MKFKGFDDWIEIFRGGKQIDANGVEHDGDALIDQAIATFDPQTHEPPLTVGHPKDNAPAFGWVEGLKKAVRDGKAVLLAKFKQVVPEFASAVEQGLFKKRSASFYPDGRLRHVGFLGAAPPAVKGLADLSFKDGGDCLVFEFADPWAWDTLARMFRRMREYFIEKDGVEAADQIIPAYAIEDLAEAAKQEPEGVQPGFGEPISTTQEKGENKMTFKEFFEMFKFWKQVQADPDMELPAGDSRGQVQAGGGDGSKRFSEADLEKARQEAAQAEREKVEAEFAEKARQAAREARKKEISAWCDQNLKAGKIAPAWADAGLVAFMEALDAEAPKDFAEGRKQTALEWFKGFIEDLPRVVEFSEIAGRKDDLGDGDEAKREQLISDFMEKHKVSYKAALLAVSKQHPALFGVQSR